jgi:hypothetical protein
MHKYDLVQFLEAWLYIWIHMEYDLDKFGDQVRITEAMVVTQYCQDECYDW